MRGLTATESDYRPKARLSAKAFFESPVQNASAFTKSPRLWGFGCSASWWWLRSPGNNPNNAANGNNNGNLNLNGNNVDWSGGVGGGVRPALPQPHMPETLP